MAKVDVQDVSEDTATTAPAEAAPAAVAEPTQTSAPAAEQPVVQQSGKKFSVKALKVSRRAAVEAALVVVVIALGLWAWTLYSDKQNLTDQLAQVNSNPQIAVEQQTKDLLDKVGKLIQLPKGETPTIAAVSDASKAKKQSAFFANAENGDKVLMYVKAGQAILYRPSTNKIVLVAPLTFSNNTSTKSTTNTTNTNTTNSSANN